MDAVLLVLTTFAGIGFGWFLNRLSAKSAVADERKHLARQTILDREEHAAARFHEELTKIASELPNTSQRADLIAEELWNGRRALLDARIRAGVLADEEVGRRAQALDAALLIQADYAMAQFRAAPRDAFGNQTPSLINPWPLEVAVRELLSALIAVQRREAPKPAIFPPAREVTALSWDETGDRGLDEVGRIVRSRLVDIASAEPT